MKPASQLSFAPRSASLGCSSQGYSVRSTATQRDDDLTAMVLLWQRPETRREALALADRNRLTSTIDLNHKPTRKP